VSGQSQVFSTATALFREGLLRSQKQDRTRTVVLVVFFRRCISSMTNMEDEFLVESELNPN
jgi:hypothetical protein